MKISFFFISLLFAVPSLACPGGPPVLVSFAPDSTNSQHTQITFTQRPQGAERDYTWTLLDDDGIATLSLVSYHFLFQVLTGHSAEACALKPALDRAIARVETTLNSVSPGMCRGEHAAACRTGVAGLPEKLAAIKTNAANLTDLCADSPHDRADIENAAAIIRHNVSQIRVYSTIAWSYRVRWSPEEEFTSDTVNSESKHRDNDEVDFLPLPPNELLRGACYTSLNMRAP